MPENALKLKLPVKIIKRILITLLCVILAVFLILLVTPLLFKNQIMELAKTELNKILLAKVDFMDLKLSFIRNFPNAYVALEGLEVTGIDDFESELLVAFDRFSVTADIMSVIRMNIEVKSILLENARLNGRILEDGSANWNIVRAGEKKAETLDTIDAGKTAEKEPVSLGFNVGLRRFEIRDLQASFRDDANNMTAEVKALNLILRGDMTKEIVDLNLQLAVDGIDFWLNSVRMANNAAVGFVSEIAADLKNLDFTLKDNRFNLNDIVLKLNGQAGIRGSDINADITFATERTDFKSLLSLVPAIYMTDFKDLQTTGSLDLSGGIKGTYGASSMPDANVNLSVNNATFRYPALPKSVEGINIALKANYDGEAFDRSTVDIDRFSFVIAGNPFSAEVHARTPESDLQVSAKFAGKIDIESITDIIPLDDMTLSGLFECDIALAGKLSTIEKEQYEDFQLEGHLNLSRFKFESPIFPLGASITNLRLNFTPRRIELANLTAAAGRTDVALNGTLENFIPFVFKNDTIRGTLALRSNTIDLNEFMGGEKKEKEKEETESSPLSVIEIPKNIDFALNINAGNILFDKLVIADTAGAVIIRDGKLVMQNLGMNLLEGSMTLNGEYNTRNMEVPFIDFNMNIRQFDISSALSSFAILANILPEPQNYVGKVSAVLTINSVLGQDMMPVLNLIDSQGRLQTQNLQIRNSKLFGTVADLIKNEAWRTPTLGNLNIGFVIKDGRLIIDDPIVISIDPVRMEIKGEQGLDMTLNYRIDAAVPVSAIGSGATDILGKIPGGSNVREVKLTGYVRGNVKNPDINLGITDMASAVVDTVREQVTEVITQKVEEVKTQVNEEVNRQIDQIMADAQRQADNIRSAAKQTADRLRNEANSAANKLVADAGSNIIQRRLAETAANTLRSEGESAAARTEREAETQINNLLSEAQRRAEDLRR